MVKSNCRQQRKRPGPGPGLAGLCMLAAAAGCAGGPAGPPGLVSGIAPARGPAPQAPDPAAGALVASMYRAVQLAGLGAAGTPAVSVDGLANYSPAPPEEFTAMRRRLARLLNGAGQGRLRFVTGAEAPLELEGAAYLAAGAGSGRWELYLRLRKAGEAWAIWRADGPVRLGRDPGSGGLHVP